MNEVKYNLVTNHLKPDPNYIFSAKFLHRSDRSLNFHWLIQRGLNKKEIQLNLSNIFSIYIFNELYLFA